MKLNFDYVWVVLYKEKIYTVGSEPSFILKTIIDVCTFEELNLYYVLFLVKWPEIYLKTLAKAQNLTQGYLAPTNVSVYIVWISVLRITGFYSVKSKIL